MEQGLGVRIMARAREFYALHPVQTDSDAERDGWLHGVAADNVKIKSTDFFRHTRTICTIISILVWPHVGYMWVCVNVWVF